MNQYNPNIHHRRSIRLRGYDYSQEGLYFITICVQERACLFGEIVGAILRDRPINGNDDRQNEIGDSDNHEMIINDAGKMVERWYFELENKYPDKRCHEMVVMPNHFHCIIENNPSMDAHVATTDAHVGAPLRGRPNNNIDPNNNDSPYGMHNKKYHATIGDAMDWFKTMTTNEYIRGVKTLGWQPFNGKLWQRNYYEHIIRNEQSHQRISDYIVNNPAKWENDKFYSK